MISVGKGALAPFSYVFVCGLLVFGKLSWASVFADHSLSAVPMLIEGPRTLQ